MNMDIAPSASPLIVMHAIDTAAMDSYLEGHPQEM